MSLDIERTRFNMVEQQVRPWDVVDLRVLDVLSQIRREDFVPAGRESLAFADVALPLAHGEFMMKPVLEGRLLQALGVDVADSVLEIGTGSGFITACLARLAREVLSIDCHADFVAEAETRLMRASLINARVMVADALEGFDPGRQFDVIAVTGAVYREPAQFRQWLRVGGRMFLIRGRSPAMEAVLIRRLGANEFVEESLFETDLAYLVHADPPRHFAL